MDSNPSFIFPLNLITIKDTTIIGTREATVSLAFINVIMIRQAEIIMAESTIVTSPTPTSSVTAWRSFVDRDMISPVRVCWKNPW